MTGTPRQAGIYCRLSYAPDGSLEKVERQEGDCRELAARMGWPVSEKHVYRDNSRSAWRRNRKRPAWQKMLDAIEDGEIDSILVYHGDRLMRQPHDLEKLLAVADSKGIRLASPSGTKNLDSPEDRFFLRIEVAQACRESDNISRRTRRGHLARAQKGRNVQGGKRPFGWGAPTGRMRVKVDRETGDEYQVEILDHNRVVPVEAKILADAAERLLAGQSLGGVVRWLNEEKKVATTQGGLWSTRTLRSLLASPRMAGLIERDGVYYQACWDAVLTQETWEDLCALFARNAEESQSSGSARVHMLSGVAECGPCGGGLIRTKPLGGKGRPNRPESKVYYCRACHKVARNAAMLDAYVSGSVLELLQDPRFAREVERATDGDSPSLGLQITELKRRKRVLSEKLDEAADDPDFDPLMAMRSIRSFDRKIDELRSQMQTSASMRLISRMVGATREEWEVEPVDVQAATVGLLFRVILVPTSRRGPGFDVDSVVIERRPLPSAEADAQAHEGADAGAGAGG